MRISRIEVQNFRCLHDVVIDCEPLTALIGPNGTGKSAVIRALEFFFGRRQVDDLDCWGGHRNLEVEVAVTLAELPPSWNERLHSFLDENQALRLTKRSISTEAGRAVEFVASRRQIVEFQAIRQAGGAMEARGLYTELRGTERFGLLPVANSQAQVLQFLEEWERDHPEELMPLEDRSLTLEGSGPNSLGPLFAPVFVPAVRDAVTDAHEGRGSTFGELTRLLVWPQLSLDERLQDLGTRVEAEYRTIVEQQGETALRTSERSLSERLARLAPGSEVRLEWDHRPPVVNPPLIQAEIVEAGFPAGVGRQGHGVQRSYILALLQELAAQTVERGTSGEDRPLLVLVVEEPELYQHPQRARLLSRIFRQLASDNGSSAQVIYATHSPFFVSLEGVESLRLLRLGQSDTPETQVSRVDLSAAATELWDASGGDGRLFTAETLRARLRILAESPVSEGFFAQGVVLVEGEEDRTVLQAVAAQESVDLEELGISILPVGGKGNLDKPLMTFRQLGIPTFTIFDGDANKIQDKQDTKSNRRLLRLLGGEETDLPDTQVHPTWACFEKNISTTLHEEIGANDFQETLNTVCSELEFAEGGEKNKTVLTEVLSRLGNEQRNSPTLKGVIDAVKTLLVSSSILVI